ncbi:hypothetical protein PC41400_08095 [Paenibacillus chitinolyticus]|uniref:Prophage tail endopeptidase domain-containing protein n=1 Tax=Paenibacillus chitinolyticus TaxID=79263 RepID=A0A410WTN2_9BACL|nr:hypothetical protein [Paenibacillus chitinolyticus]MCY9599132.1 hypothetical protein [Paenibacillus chitinolyticus]QAV17627.1 hypothetical protein PC41400_08095 [Paenibacillus chitinolyticus]
MQYCSSDYLAALKSPIKQMYLKFEFYDAQMNYISEFTKQITAQDSGSISVDASRPVRRSFSFKLMNRKNEFNFGEDNLIWIDKRVKVFTGLKLRTGEIEYIPQGVFILTEPEDSHTVEGKITSLSGMDKMFLCTDKRGKFRTETTIDAGGNIGAIIRVLAQKYGETQFNFDPITETIPYTFTFQPSDNIYKAMSDLALLAKCELFYDVNGYLRLRKIDLNQFEQSPSVWMYVHGDPNERFYAGNVRKFDENQLANRIMVLGGSSQIAESRFELIITETNPLWKGHPYSIEKIGEITYEHNSGNPDSLLATNEECKWRAKYELMNRLGYAERVSLSLSPNHLHDANDVIEIEDVENSVTGKYLLQSFSLPLTPQLMNCECMKYRRVIADWNFI